MGGNIKKVPAVDRFINPLIKALRELGGSGTIAEIYEKVVKILNLPDEMLEIPHGREGAQSEVAYRLAVARTYLRKYGMLENSARGVWAISPAAKDPDKIDPGELVKQARSQARKKTPDKPSQNDNPAGNGAEKPEETGDWRDTLRKILIAMHPAAFERLVQRVLRESGFTQVEVTGRTGDGGIDGKGIARVHGLLSFHIIFQCKKYQGSVNSSQIRDFRGAMQGRSDKGLFITTGSFTRDAVKEATRDGAPPIDLIDGEQLIEKLKELSLGVNTKIIQAESVEIDYEWFQQI